MVVPLITVITACQWKFRYLNLTRKWTTDLSKFPSRGPNTVNTFTRMAALENTHVANSLCPVGVNSDLGQQVGAESRQPQTCPSLTPSVLPSKLLRPLVVHEMTLTLSPPGTLTLIFSRPPPGRWSHLILQKESRDKYTQTPLTQIYQLQCICSPSSAFTPVTKERASSCFCEAVFLIYSSTLFRPVFLIVTEQTYCISAYKLHSIYALGKKNKLFCPLGSIFQPLGGNIDWQCMF